MSRFSKALILGIVTGILGFAFCFISFGHKIEQRITLDILFKMRGQQKPPSDVVVVSLDKLSADYLNLPNNPQKWPHRFYARIIENLIQEGAGVIAFDIFFGESHSKEDDILFSRAMSRAHNVVLVSTIKTDKVMLEDRRGLPAGDMNIEKLVSPIQILSQSSMAVAPFPLPKVPVKVSQYWTFKPSAGDTPTLPVVVFQAYALDVYDDFYRLLSKFDPSIRDRIPGSRDELLHSENLANEMRIIRESFLSNPKLTEMMLSELQNSHMMSADPEKEQRIRSLIKMYQSSESSYINFYGYPHTITTIPYYEVLELHKDPDARGKNTDFRGKAVFVGVSEIYQPEQRDGHHTVFSQSNGLEISGVEIAATAFANLLEDMPVQPLSFRRHFLIILVWGVIMGILCRLFTNIISVLSVLGLGIAYFIAALHQFKTGGILFPVFTPLFFQIPLAFFGAIIWKNADTNKERQNIKRAFSYYLPDNVVEKISRNISNVGKTSQVVYGTCLSTDAEKYTTLSETMGPGELSIFMNKYYEAVFRPVKHHGGIVSNVIADAMLAIWVTVQPDVSTREQACLAAIDIRKAVCDHTSDAVHMPTRIGLHTGHISLGNIGAIDHFEYRPVGDIVNTSTRIESLNKYLGTRILLSEEVLSRLDGFLTRRVGKFLFAGKIKSLEIHELLCIEEEATPQEKDKCEMFSHALDAFSMQSWEAASGKFREFLDRFKEDGPSLFYLKMCEEYRDNPPGEAWDGTINLYKK
jgi:adenylate cyclase